MIDTAGYGKSDLHQVRIQLQHTLETSEITPIIATTRKYSLYSSLNNHICKTCPFQKPQAIITFHQYQL